MSSSPPTTISDMVEALCLFDEPMLNSRYHALLTRRGLQASGAELTRLPSLALECSRLARDGAAEWDRNAMAVATSDEFVAWAEHAVMEAFLQLSEAQLRVAAHIARSAPDARTRRPFDLMCERHREISSTLRRALKGLPMPAARSAAYRRSVQEEEPNGDFRGQLEEAARAAEASGVGVRHIVLSPTGLRHLRDQGCFKDETGELLGYPVSVDMGWDAPAFVIETYERVSLDEILRGEAEEPSQRDASAEPPPGGSSGAAALHG